MPWDAIQRYRLFEAAAAKITGIADSGSLSVLRAPGHDRGPRRPPCFCFPAFASDLLALIGLATQPSYVHSVGIGVFLNLREIVAAQQLYSQRFRHPRNCFFHLHSLAVHP
jgi:hypothetical protein